MRGLRVTMYAWGGLMLVTGLVAMLFPSRIEAFAGGGATNTFLLGSWGWLEALLGMGVILAGRDPIRHILWVRVAGLGLGVGAAYDVLHYLTGTITLGVVALDLIAYAVFGAIFLALYPRTPRMVPLGVHTTRGTLYTDIDRGGLFIRRGDIWLAYALPAQEPPRLTATAPTAPEAMALVNGATDVMSNQRRESTLASGSTPDSAPAAAPVKQTEAINHRESH